ncbi:MAG: hypothetical protein LUM44_04720 [Pyrinomonadaceae bacterium]|nr:hypothetical protein [Pyrinomonadaceae bacterium]
MKVEKYEVPSEAFEIATEMGYSPDKLPLLFMVPLVQVAWAEGFVQAGEKRVIRRYAGSFQINGDEENLRQLDIWLDERPSDEFCEESLEDLQIILVNIPAKQAAYLREILQTGCIEVANAAGEIGLLRSRSSIQREEKELLKDLGDRLGLRIQAILNPVG